MTSEQKTLVPRAPKRVDPQSQSERQGLLRRAIRGGVHSCVEDGPSALLWGIPVGLRFAPASLHPPQQSGETKNQQQLTKRGHSLLSYKGDISIKF